ncbi:MAG TPA: class I SAM-dependent methyltransferase [Actinobacteria bacterium]|nr:class I SAM-dependent methyltransferase [Actinomycetota bacterium]
MTNWDSLASWWELEIVTDPAYREDVLPLLGDLVGSMPAGVVLDLGCGEGQGARSVGGTVVGIDSSHVLLRSANRVIPVVQACLPDLGAIRDESVAGAFAVMVIEHVEDLEALFDEAARVVRRGGWFVVVSNHPAYTAPGAGPIYDMSDGEYLWRWGPYFERSRSHEPAGPATMVFHHRPLGDLLTAAAARGWMLDRMVERGLGQEAVRRDPTLAGQQHFPRLVGFRWHSAV